MRALLRCTRSYRWLIASALVALLALVPYHRAGDPPGVDAPTFLHFAWVFEQFLTGESQSFLRDDWWYGGLPYLQAYSPAGYGSVGLLSAATPMGVAAAFRLVVAVSLVGTALSTFWLGRQLSLRPVNAFMAASLVVLAYPVLSGIGIYGWLPTATSLPLALTAYAFVERWTDSGSRRDAVAGGALIGLSLLFHHMTAIAIGIAVVVRMVLFVVEHRSAWRTTARAAAIFLAAAVLVSGWWAVPFVSNTLAVGFEREIPGNWRFGTAIYFRSLFDRGLIGIETYPAYIGYAQGILGIGGAIYAISYRTRFAGVSITALVLLWFSMGSSANPLIRTYPFSGLDVSRFAYYVAPMLALLSAAAVQHLLDGVDVKSNIPKVAIPLALVLAAGVDAFAARSVLEPVREPAHVKETIAWLDSQIPAETTVLAVGFRNWDGYWLPARSDLRIMDGWYDEGAENWREIREYRLMGWFGEVDPDRLRQIMESQHAEYLVIVDWDQTDSPGLFEAAARNRPDLFIPVASLDRAAIYSVN